MQEATPDSGADGPRKTFFGRMITGGTIIGTIGFFIAFAYFVHTGSDANLNHSVIAFCLYTLPYLVAIILPLIIILFRARILGTLKGESSAPSAFVTTWGTGLILALAFASAGWTIASASTRLFFLFSK